MKQRGKKKKELNEENLGDLWDNVKHPKTHINHIMKIKHKEQILKQKGKSNKFHTRGSP